VRAGGAARRQSDLLHHRLGREVPYVGNVAGGRCDDVHAVRGDGEAREVRPLGLSSVHSQDARR
jgi:hypothetical protein